MQGAFRSPSTGGIRQLSLGADGRIVAYGAFSTANNRPRQFIARLERGGTLDDTFDPGLGPEVGVPSVTGQSIAHHIDGRIVIHGPFTSYDGYSSPGIAQISGISGPDRPRITNVTLLERSLSLSVQTVAGLHYSVEFKDTLGNREWRVITQITGDGSSRSLTDPSATGSARFYRVRAE